MLPDLALIVVDTLRFDSLGACEPSYPFTPRLRERMAGWVAFERCYTAAPWTMPSVTTILSGVHATRHGRYFHAGEQSPVALLPDHLPDEYVKVGHVNNGNLQPNRGWAAGFDEYRYAGPWDEPFDGMAAFLDRDDGRSPRFLLLHTNLPHDYGNPGTKAYYVERFPDRRDWFQMMGPPLITWRGVPGERRRRVRSFYDACVARMDERLAELLDRLDLDRTIVCLVADHGEGFEPDRARVHHGGRVHDDLVRVPLVIHVPPTVEAGAQEALRRATEATVSTADIVPTLLDLAGLPIPPGLDGQSLLREVPDDRVVATEDRRFLYLPSCERLNVNRDGKNTTRATRLRNRVLQATAARGHHLKGFVRQPYKLVVTSFAPPPRIADLAGPVVERLVPTGTRLVRRGGIWSAFQLFHLGDDPQEAHDLLVGRDLAEAIRLLDERLPGWRRFEVLVDGADRHLGELLSGTAPA